MTMRDLSLSLNAATIGYITVHQKAKPLARNLAKFTWRTIYRTPLISMLWDNAHIFK